MYQLVVLFFEIAILRKGPQDVPANPWLLRLVLPLYIGVNVLILQLNSDLWTAVLQMGADFALVCGFSWPLLYFAAKPARFRQTLCALIGTDTVISFFAIPAVASLDSQANTLALFAMLALMAWHWAVMGHIFRHALDRPLFFGLGLALLYILISSQVMALLFPVVSTQS